MPTVYMDAGNWTYTLVLEWFLQQSRGPLAPSASRLRSLSQDHQGDVIEATLAYLRAAARVGPLQGQGPPTAAQRQLRQFEALLCGALETIGLAWIWWIRKRA